MGDNGVLLNKSSSLATDDGEDCFCPCRGGVTVTTAIGRLVGGDGGGGGDGGLEVELPKAEAEEGICRFCLFFLVFLFLDTSLTPSKSCVRVVSSVDALACGVLRRRRRRLGRVRCRRWIVCLCNESRNDVGTKGWDTGYFPSFVVCKLKYFSSATKLKERRGEANEKDRWVLVRMGTLVRKTIRTLQTACDIGTAYVTHIPLFA